MAKHIPAYRQGDVILVRHERLPTNLEEVKSLVLADGEVTGHSHALMVETAPVVLRDPKTGTLWVRADQAAVIVHEEHGALSIDPGIYEVVIEREYEPDGWRQVVD